MANDTENTQLLRLWTADEILSLVRSQISVDTEEAYECGNRYLNLTVRVGGRIAAESSIRLSDD